MSHMRHFLEPLLWTDVQWFRPTPLMFHTFVDICLSFPQFPYLQDIWLQCSRGIIWGGVVWVSDHGTSMAGEVLGWFLGLLLRVWPWMEVLTDVRQGQVQMVECLKAVCLMVKGSGEVAGGVCASMHATHKIGRVVVESGEHYGWFMERQDKLVEFRRMLYMVVESGPQNIRRVVVEGSEHSGWFMEEQEDKLVEFWRML